MPDTPPDKVQEDLAAIISTRLTFANFRDLDDDEMAKMFISELRYRGWRIVGRDDLKQSIANMRHSSDCPKYVPETAEYACTCYVARLRAALSA